MFERVHAEGTDAITQRKEDYKLSSRIFVYGTLLRGYPNHPIISSGKLIKVEETQIEGTLFHLRNWPGLSLLEPLTPIYGEIWDISAEQLQAVDQLEGHPRHYKRVLLKVPDVGFVWTYVYPIDFLDEEARFIPSGRWLGSKTTFSEKWPGVRPNRKTIDDEEIRTVHKVPCESADGPGWFYLVDDKTKAATGPFKVTGERMGSDGKIKPLLATLPSAKEKLYSPLAEATRRILTPFTQNNTNGVPMIPRLTVGDTIKQVQSKITHPSKAGPGIRRI